MAKSAAGKQVAGKVEGLSPKHQLFVAGILAGKSQVDAYLAAGYKDTPAAKDHAARLAANGSIQAAVAGGLAASAKRTEISIDLVVQEAWKKYQRCVEAKEFAAANKALELLGRHVGAFPLRHEHTGADGGPIEIIGLEVLVARATRPEDA